MQVRFVWAWADCSSPWIKLKQKNLGISVKGFIKYIWHADDDSEDAVQDLKVERKQIENQLVIDWQQEMKTAGVIQLDKKQIETLRGWEF